ncbi:MAG: ABC transporter substrate-binding protein/permease [Bacteriovoracia bacterium]
MIFVFLCCLTNIIFAQTQKPLRIGLTGKYPPFNYYNESGKLTGFDIDITNELCAALNRKCIFVPLQWDGILASLLAGKIDLIIGSMAITPARTKQALFSEPYYESGAQIFSTKQATDYKKAGYRLGVTLGTTYERVVRKSLPDAEIKTYKGDTAILQDIQAGRLDAIITDRLVGGFMIRKFGVDLIPTGPILYEEKMGIPARPQDKELIEKLNQKLLSLRESKKYSDLFEKYFGLSVYSEKSELQWKESVTLLLKGLWGTVKVSLAGLLLGLVLSTLLATILIAAPKPVVSVAKILTDFVRSTPFLIQLFGIYFGLPSVGVVISAFTAAVITIGIHSSAYLAEVLVAGYRAVPKEQRQASKLLGLNRLQTLQYVVFPQMIPVITAPVLNTVVAMIKDSAIVSVISVYELTMQAQQLISATYRPFIFYLLAAVLYAFVTYPLLLLGRRVGSQRKVSHGN